MHQSGNLESLFSPMKLSFLLNGVNGAAPWLIVFAVFVGAMAFLAVPQFNRVKDHEKFLMTLKIGDRVVTTGGLIGTLQQVDGDTLLISFSNMEPIPILRSAIERTMN